MPAARYHRGLPFLAALALVLAALVWAWWRTAHILPGAPLRPGGVAARHDYQAGVWPDPVAPVEAWSMPVAQTSGADWTYEVFSSPAIYHNPVSGKYTAGNPEGADAGKDRASESAGPEIEPFPLKLVGFVGNEGHYLGTFENVRTSEHFLAKTGQPVSELGLTIVEFTVKKMGHMLNGTPLAGLVALAVVRDDRTGAVTTLKDREPNAEAASGDGFDESAIQSLPKAGSRPPEPASPRPQS